MNMDALAALDTTTNTLRIGFLGAGKAGCSLGRYIVERLAGACDPAAPALESALAGSLSPALLSGDGDSSSAHASACTPVKLSGYASKTYASAQVAARVTGAPAFEDAVSLLRASDILFISVPDGAIRPACESLAQACQEECLTLDGKLVGHLSGSLSSGELDSAAALGAHTFSLHPACALPDREHGWEGLPHALFAFEGEQAARERVRPLTDLLGNQVGEIGREHKTLYHAACVFLSNLGVGLAAKGLDLLSGCGLDEAFSTGLLQTLYLNNAGNVARTGPTAALTGPAERADAQTMRGHMAALTSFGDEDALRVYKEMSGVLLTLAQKKHPEWKEGCAQALRDELFPH
ncbi:MAG: DUF2520 domain-containing protein [Clostridiales Family XIII bacterium]|jgi:predicted short-subunit dehydrogenase-like oxidoreductase (DUF2520 family)|nr:DUF2520 domain-containing protein [Clostridiales Family XIII bacterium]